MKRMLTTTALALCCAALPASAFDYSAMNSDERAAFGAAVRDYLMENPQVIMDAVAQLEQRQADQRVEDDLALVTANKDALLDDGFSWVGGNPDGDITVVEFLDYRCGYCRRAHEDVANLLSSDGNIKLIVKEFPILGEASVVSSRVAIAVRQLAGPEAYKSVHDALISFNGDLSDRAIRRIANGLELDGDAILARMDSEEVTKEIYETRLLAQRLQINGTPTFVMGDQLVRGYVPIDGMRQIISEERG